MSERIIANAEVQRLLAEIPDGHRHLRVRIELTDGSVLVLQEATAASLVRAYVTVKTDPRRRRVVLTGRRLEERKDGYAEWQLLEE